MASVPPPPPRDLSIGTIIDKTLGVLDRCTVPALVYLAVFTVINGALAYYAPSTAAVKAQLIGALLKFVVGVVGGYLLIETMVRKTGLRTRTDNEAFLPYLLMLVPYTLGVMLGLIVFILPGLIIMARWSIAQPLLVARGDRPMQALGESWELTKGNEFQILVALLALLILPIVIIITCGALFEKDDLVGIAVAQLATSATSVLAMAMNVALYALVVVARNVTAPSA
jgi:uncharacterized membrane protein